MNKAANISLATESCIKDISQSSKEKNSEIPVESENFNSDVEKFASLLQKTEKFESDSNENNYNININKDDNIINEEKLFSLNDKEKQNINNIDKSSVKDNIHDQSDELYININKKNISFELDTNPTFNKIYQQSELLSYNLDLNNINNKNSFVDSNYDTSLENTCDINLKSENHTNLDNQTLSHNLLSKSNLSNINNESLQEKPNNQTTEYNENNNFFQTNDERNIKDIIENNPNIQNLGESILSSFLREKNVDNQTVINNQKTSIDINEIAEKIADRILISTENSNGSSEIRIQIKQEILPNTEIQIIKTNDHININFITQSNDSLDILNNNIQLLSQNLNSRFDDKITIQINSNQTQNEQNEGRSKQQRNLYDELEE